MPICNVALAALVPAEPGVEPSQRLSNCRQHRWALAWTSMELWR
jgi:hypothetical protein